MTQWANYFPQIEAYSTKDPRIFQTKFATVQKSTDLEGTNGVKMKRYFCCIVGGNCYGVEVLRHFAVSSKKECDEAYFKVKAAADYYESNNTWPDGNDSPKETS